jgi:Ca2+-binding RTX toxin-like protein
MAGGAGADQLDGGAGLDGVIYAGSTAGVKVDLAAHTASGGDAEGDTLNGIEALSGSDFDDILTGDALANFIQGEGGFDRLNGGGGNDRVQGTGVLAGGGGNDTVFGGDTLANVMNGNGGGDLMGGGELNDTMSGGDGNDVINGYLGADQLRGGTGADKFQYFSFDESSPAAQDVIFDFSRAQHDRIDVELVFDDINTQTDETFHFLGTAGFTGHAGELRFVEVANRNQTFVQADIDGDRTADLQIKLIGLIALSAADFIL